MLQAVVEIFPVISKTFSPRQGRFVWVKPDASFRIMEDAQLAAEVVEVFRKRDPLPAGVAADPAMADYLERLAFKRVASVFFAVYRRDWPTELGDSWVKIIGYRYFDDDSRYWSGVPEDDGLDTMRFEWGYWRPEGYEPIEGSMSSGDWLRRRAGLEEEVPF